MDANLRTYLPVTLVAVLAAVAGGALFARGPSGRVQDGQSLRELQSTVERSHNDLARAIEALRGAAEQYERERLAPVGSPTQSRQVAPLEAASVPELPEALRRVEEKLDSLLAQSVGGSRSFDPAAARPFMPSEARDFISAHPNLAESGDIPIELTFMGVEEIVERFGRPTSFSLNGSGLYTLKYLFNGEDDPSGPRVEFQCGGAFTRRIEVHR